MVAAKVLRVDETVLHPVAKAVRAEKIVYAPAGVLLSGVEHIAPPAVSAGFIRIEQAEAVGKAGGEKLRHFAPLLVGEAGVAAVRLVVFEVDFIVSDIRITIRIQISAKNFYTEYQEL